MIVFITLFYIINVVVDITTEPMNATVCLTQSTIANFTCVVNAVGITVSSTGWQMRVGEELYISVNGIDRHTTDFRASMNGDTITDTLTVHNVSVDDDGAQYRCQPIIGGVSSDVVTLTVLGMCICNYYVLY